MPEYRQAQRIFCFVGTQAEIDTAPIIEDALSKGKIVGVPRCVDKGIMNVCRIESLKGLEMGQYGILEPGEEAAILLPEEIDFAVVPAFHAAAQVSGWDMEAGIMTGIWPGQGLLKQ